MDIHLFMVALNVVNGELAESVLNAKGKVISVEPQIFY